MESGDTAERGVQERDLSASADQRSQIDVWAIRAGDIKPYVSLQYIARMLKLLAVLVLVGLVAEIAAGLSTEGRTALVPIFAQGVQFLMIAAGLRAAADLAGLAIDVGHDIRADRILLGRLADHGVVKRSAAAVGAGSEPSTPASHDH